MNERTISFIEEHDLTANNLEDVQVAELTSIKFQDCNSSQWLEIGRFLLKKAPRLVGLQIINCPVPASLGRTISRMEQLQLLDITDSIFERDVLLRLINSLKKLKVLRLGRVSELSSFDIENVCHILLSMDEIQAQFNFKELSLFCHNDPKMVVPLAALAANLRKLKVICKSKGFGDIGAELLAVKLPALTHLDLTWCEISFKGFKAIAHGLASLRSLCLRNRFGDQEFNLIAKNLIELVVFEAHYSQLTSDSFLEAARCLPKVKKIEIGFQISQQRGRLYGVYDRSWRRQIWRGHPRITQLRVRDQTALYISRGSVGKYIPEINPNPWKHDINN